METRHRHRMVGKELFDPIPQRLSDTVTQFDSIEPEREDFVQHFVATGVTT
jgi:hypothetical protein